MKIKFVALNTFLSEKVADASQFGRATSIALGICLGRATPLPENPPASAERFYSEAVQSIVERAAADFNEHIVIDLDLACQVARSIWVMRCNFLHPSQMIELPQADTPGDWMVGLSAAGFTMSRDVYDYVCANRDCIYVMANRIAATMAEGDEERRTPAPVVNEVRA